MALEWKEKILEINEYPEDVNYVICIDECGCSFLKNIVNAIKNKQDIQMGEKFFAIAACVLNKNNSDYNAQLIVDLKNKYWQDGFYTYNDGPKEICFHSHDIRNRKGPFSIEKYNDFAKDLGEVISKIKMDLYVAYIDKEKLCRTYTEPLPTYQLSMLFILERIVRNLNKDDSCIIVLESRDKNQNKILHNEILKILNFGTDYVEKEKFDVIKGVYFNKKWTNKHRTHWGLELADLCVYPIYQYYSYKKRSLPYDIVESKIFNFPHYEGTGLKIFP